MYETGSEYDRSPFPTTLGDGLDIKHVKVEVRNVSGDHSPHSRALQPDGACALRQNQS